MIYLLILLFALWNGYVIRWKHHNGNRDSKIWHMIGRLCVGGLLITGLLPLFSWGVYVINPALLLTPWHGGVLTVLLAFGCSYWIYDRIINHINGWRWDYAGTKDSKFWRAELYAWIGLVLLWAALGGWLEKWVNTNTI